MSFATNFLEKYWKALMWVTIVFLIISAGVLVNNILTTGSFMKRDIDLSGGKEITVQIDDVDLRAAEQKMPYADFRVVSGVTKTLVVEIPFEVDEDQAVSDLRQAVSFIGEPGVRIVGPSLGGVFFQQAQIALLVAFILMAFTVFILFRSIAPSLIVMMAAATDIIGTMGILSVIGTPLSLPVIGALLALIGYSVGTDILLTAELVKSGRDDYKQSVFRAAKTGITLTATALVALLAMLFISGSTVIEQIAMVMLIGLLIDIPATWLTNAGIMRMWLERKRRAR